MGERWGYYLVREDEFFDVVDVKVWIGDWRLISFETYMKTFKKHHGDPLPNFVLLRATFLWSFVVFSLISL
jgi:hypothetical protein